MNKKLFILLLIIISFNSCDILRLSPFEIVSWTPGEGYFPEPENIAVTLYFSHDPDKASVEKYFSLTGDGEKIRGTFFWDGRKMTFYPLTPLEHNTDYIINISADANNTSGLSLEEAFKGYFTTRSDNTRPVLLSCYPQMYAEVNDPRTEVRLAFSLPVSLKTLYDNVSFYPSITGSWRLEDESRLAVFTPSEPWTPLAQYEIKYSTSLTDNKGMNIGNDFTSFFKTGTDWEAPYLLHARRITNNGDIVELNPDRGYAGAAESPVENNNWEKDDRLSLVFSKPVDGLSVKNYLNAEEAPAFVLETPYPAAADNFNSEFTFRFDDIPAYESRFTIRLKPGVKDIAGNESKDEYIYRIFANGICSKPPMLAGLRIPMVPDNKTEPEFFCASADSIFKKIPITDKNYPSEESVQTWIEFYFLTTEGASIDLFSLMELFRIETSNNVITFSPLQLKTSDFTITDPHHEWEKFERVEIKGKFTNSVNIGLIIFQIAPGLKDTLGNKNEKPQRISVIK